MTKGRPKSSDEDPDSIFSAIRWFARNESKIWQPALMALLAIWLLTPLVMKHVWLPALQDECGTPLTIGDAGSLGDTFGAFNSLVSAAALLLLVINAMQQQKTINLQKEEIEDSKEAMDRQMEISMLTVRQTISQANLIAEIEGYKNNMEDLFRDCGALLEEWRGRVPPVGNEKEANRAIAILNSIENRIKNYKNRSATDGAGRVSVIDKLEIYLSDAQRHVDAIIENYGRRQIDADRLEKLYKEM